MSPREVTLDVKISDAEIQKVREAIDARFGDAADGVAVLCDKLFTSGYALVVDLPGGGREFYSAHTPSEVAGWLEAVAREIRDGIRVGPVEIGPVVVGASPETSSP